jgi:WD repeat and SOF domain-containing protein 1
LLTALPAQLLPREKKKAAYDAALVARYAHVPEVKRIARCVACRDNTPTMRGYLNRPRCRHRHVPKAIHKAGALRRTMEDSQRRKRANTIKHSKPGSVELKPARKERLVAELS